MNFEPWEIPLLVTAVGVVIYAVAELIARRGTATEGSPAEPEQPQESDGKKIATSAVLATLAVVLVIGCLVAIETTQAQLASTITAVCAAISAVASALTSIQSYVELQNRRANSSKKCRPSPRSRDVSSAAVAPRPSPTGAEHRLEGSPPLAERRVVGRYVVE